MSGKLTAPKMPFRALVAGGSGSGKTYMVTKLLLEHFGPNKIKRLIWVAPKYSLEQPKVKLLQDVYGDQMVVVDGTEGWTKEVQEKIDRELLRGRQRGADGAYPDNTLLLLDDMLAAKSRARYVSNLYTTARHLGVSIIELVQRVFSGDRGTRTQRLNCTQFWLLGFPGGMTEVKALIDQVEAKDIAPKLFAKYREILRRDPHGYLYLDLTQKDSDPARYRDSDLGNAIHL